jgi:phosphatidylglycerol lysyltransferase
MEHAKGFKRIMHLVLPLVSVSLFILALRVLFHELRTYDFNAVIGYFHSIPLTQRVAAVTAVLLSYFMLTMNDVLGLRYVGHRLAYGKIAFTSFTGYAFSNSIGYSVLSGGAIRYRFYSSWGLSALEIAKVVLFCFVSVVIGYLTLAGVAFTVEGVAIPSLMHFRIPLRTVRPIGILLLALLALYFVLAIFWKRPVRIRKMQFSFPSLSLAVLQAAVSSLDWFFAAAVLYLLLPPDTGISIFHFIGIFLLGQLAGLASQIPGGLGVFEMVMVLLLPESVKNAEVVGALLSFRILYYFAPLMLAGLLFGGFEFFHRHIKQDRLSTTQAKNIYRLAPQVFAAITFAAGAILMISGTIPPLQARMEFLSKLLPLLAIDMSHFAASIVGLCLLLLAVGIQQRVSAAYYTVIGFLIAGIVLALLRGMHFGVAAVLGVTLLMLIPARREFNRRALLVEQRFTLEWTMAVVLVMLTSLWLGLFAIRNVGYSDELWWQFSLRGDASRLLRAGVGVTVVLLAVSVHRLLRPAVYRQSFPGRDQIDRARAIIRTSQNPSASLALLGDKSLLFSGSGRSFVMYGVHGRSWVALGDPVGPEREWNELILEYRSLCSRYGGLPAFFDIAEDHVSLYRDLGFSLFKLGEEALVHLPGYGVEVGEKRELWGSIRESEVHEWSVEVVDPETVPDILDELRQVSSNWLALHGGRERGFSQGFFNADYLVNCPHTLLRNRGGIAGFCTILTDARGESCALGMLRWRSKPPEYAFHSLLDEVLQWGKNRGYTWLNIGTMPLQGMNDDELSPVWARVGNVLFPIVEYFGDVTSLREFVAEFRPLRKPRYLALTGGLSIPRVLLDVASLISVKTGSRPMKRTRRNES